MAKIYQFRARKKTLRQMIAAGRITEKIITHLQEAHQRHETLYPDDPDTAFIRQMITYTGPLSEEDKKRLVEILKYEIDEEEHPHGILDITFRI